VGRKQGSGAIAGEAGANFSWDHRAGPALGIPDRGYRRGYRCRGFYDRYDRFQCYR